MNAPCFCQCAALNCMTLAHEYPDGSHDHYPWLPCRDAQPPPGKMPQEEQRERNARRHPDRILRFKAQHKFRTVPERPLFQDEHRPPYQPRKKSG